MELGKISLLIGSLAAGVFGGGNKVSDHTNALFFIGNGAYYATDPEDSVKKPHSTDPYKDCDTFIRNFIPDAIVSDFTRALHEKEPHIFINAKIWNSFVRARKRALQLFMELSITNPLEQIYINNTNVIPTALSNKFDQKLALIEEGTHACAITKAPRTTVWNHPVFFSAMQIQALKLLPLNQRLDAFKQTATILHPYLHKILHFLFVFDVSAWRMYDTKNGLYYLTHKDSTHVGIATENFIELNTHHALENELEEPQKSQEFIWTTEPDTLFEPTKKPWRIYISGHGSNRVPSPNGATEEHCTENEQTISCTRAQIAGMPSTCFKQLLQFFNEKITVERLVVSSCYTPAQRLLALFPGPYQFDLITPISEYVPVSGFVPLIYTSQYVPAWLSATNRQQLEYTVHTSGDKKSTPIRTLKKFSALLNTKVSHDLKRYMQNLYDPAEDQDPVIVYANKYSIQKLS